MIFLGGLRGWAAAPQHPGTPATLLPHSEAELFLNLKIKKVSDNYQRYSCARDKRSRFRHKTQQAVPDPFFPRSMREYPSFPGYRLTTRQETDSCDTSFSSRFTFLLSFWKKRAVALGVGCVSLSTLNQN